MRPWRDLHLNVTWCFSFLGWKKIVCVLVHMFILDLLKVVGQKSKTYSYQRIKNGDEYHGRGIQITLNKSEVFWAYVGSTNPPRAVLVAIVARMT